MKPKWNWRSQMTNSKDKQKTIAEANRFWKLKFNLWEKLLQFWKKNYHQSRAHMQSNWRSSQLTQMKSCRDFKLLKSNLCRTLRKAIRSNLKPFNLELKRLWGKRKMLNQNSKDTLKCTETWRSTLRTLTTELCLKKSQRIPSIKSLRKSANHQSIFFDINNDIYLW